MRRGGSLAQFSNSVRHSPSLVSPPPTLGEHLSASLTSHRPTLPHDGPALPPLVGGSRPPLRPPPPAALRGAQALSPRRRPLRRRAAGPEGGHLPRPPPVPGRCASVARLRLARRRAAPAGRRGAFFLSFPDAPFLTLTTAQELPPWIKDSTFERVAWLNTLLRQLWPHLDAAITRKVLDAVAAALAGGVGMGMAVHLNHFSLGARPLTLCGVRALGDPGAADTPDSCVLDIDVRLASTEPNAVAVISGGTPYRLRRRRGLPGAAAAPSAGRGAGATAAARAAHACAGEGDAGAAGGGGGRGGCGGGGGGAGGGRARGAGRRGGGGDAAVLREAAWGALEGRGRRASFGKKRAVTLYGARPAPTALTKGSFSGVALA